MLAKHDVVWLLSRVKQLLSLDILIGHYSKQRARPVVPGQPSSFKYFSLVMKSLVLVISTQV